MNRSKTMLLQSINPTNDEILRSFSGLTEEALRERIALAAGARHAPLEHRVLCLRKLAVLLTEESDELARMVTLETGKPLRASVAEIARCADACLYDATNAVRWLAPELLATGAGQAYVQWAPVGVILAVMPGAWPFWTGLRFAIPALVAGNTVLMKLPSSVPQCALSMAALVRRAGFTRGVFTALLMDDRLVETALNDERVAAVTVHGTQAAGRALAAQAGWLLKKSTLHLSGSDPFVVMPSADLDEAVATAVQAFTMGTGAGKRLILHETIHNDFVRRLVMALEALRIGDPMKAETELGPLPTPEALQTLSDQVDAAVAAGGCILTGGTRLVGRGNFFEPTLLSDVPNTSAVARDALAGPLAMVFRVRDLAEAVELANDSPHGAGAAVWTREPAEQQQLLSKVKAGCIALNALPEDDARLPRGPSGSGRSSAIAGIHDYLRATTVFLA